MKIAIEVSDILSPDFFIIVIRLEEFQLRLGVRCSIEKIYI